MASFKVYYDEKQECVIASLEGKSDFEILKKYAKRILETGEKHQCKVLFNDVRKEEPAFSLTDFLKIMNMIISMGLDDSWKKAMVVAKRSLGYRFYEALTVNEAINLKLFVNPYEAMIWLKKSD